MGRQTERPYALIPRLTCKKILGDGWDTGKYRLNFSAFVARSTARYVVEHERLCVITYDRLEIGAVIFADDLLERLRRM